ncbi:MAG: ferritin-like domain-containing protein [Planctomycetes bacterium]|nr:ferritin-like domain-containing protein [Planctomycetota bacterium]
MTSWLQRLAGRRARRPEFFPRGPLSVEADFAPALARSLARFQLGETGDGSHLLAAAAKLGDADRVELLRRFLDEEHDHARWLGRAVEALGGQRLERHWSASAFRLVRRLGGVETELIVLMAAELLGATYYRALARHVRDPQLRGLLGQIARDEGVHIALHVDWQRRHLHQLGPVRRALFRVGFHAFFRAVCVMVMLDHRAVLRRCGGLRSYWRASGDLLARVTAAQLRPCRLTGRALLRFRHLAVETA